MLMEPDQMLMTGISPLFMLYHNCGRPKAQWWPLPVAVFIDIHYVQSHDWQGIYLERLNSLHDRGSTGHQVLHDEASLPLLECALNGLLGAIILHLHRQWRASMLSAWLDVKTGHPASSLP